MKNFFQKVFTYINLNPFLKSIFTLSAGQIFSVSLNILITPLFSRLYPKEAFGDYAILASTAGLIIGLIGLGLGSAVMVPKDIKESESILKSLFIVQFFLTSLILLFLLILSPYFKIFTINIPYYESLLFLFLYIIFGNLSSLLIVYFNKLKMNRVLMIYPLLLSLTSIFVKLWFISIDLPFYGLIISTIIANLISSIYLLKLKNPFNKIPFLPEIIAVFVKYRNFVFFQYPANLINQISVQIPNQFIGRIFGNSILAELEMSNKIVQQPINIVSNPIQTIYFRTSSVYYNNGGNLALFTIKLIGVLFLIGFIPTLLLTLYGELIFIFILGDQWMQAGQVSSIMATSLFFSFIYATITYGRVVMGRQKSNLASTIFYLIILIFLLFLFNFNNNLFIQTIFAVSIASLLFNVSNIYITLKYMNNYHNEFLIFSILFIVINAFILVFKYLN